MKVEMYIRSLNVTDLCGVVMVILVVGCGYGQHLGRHQHLKDLNATWPAGKENKNH